MKRTSLVILALLSLGLAPAFAETKPMKAAKDEVVFVVKLVVQPELPLEFYKQYMVESKRGLSDTRAYAWLYTPGSWMAYQQVEVCGLNEFGFFAVKAERDRIFHFRGLQARLFDAQALSIDVPVNAALKVREGVQYVYLGTFVYRFGDEYFSPVSLERRDEFDAAYAALKAGLGPDVTLARATLTDLAEAAPAR